MTIRILAIDGNWQVHRSKSVNSKLPEDQLVRTVSRQVTSWALRYAIRHRATHIFVGFDGERCFRNEVWPLYKANRKSALDKHGQPLAPEKRDTLLMSGHKLTLAHDPVHACAEATRAMLSQFGVAVEHRAEFEADDLLMSAASMADSPSVEAVVLNAKDKDIVQAIRPKVVQWYDEPRTKSEVTLTYDDLSSRMTPYVHEDAVGWTPIQFRDYQILIGDGMDNVPEIVRPAIARKIINKYGRLRKFFKTERGEEFFQDYQNLLGRNLQLISMVPDIFNEDDLASWKFVPPKNPPDYSKSLTEALTELSSMQAVISRPRLFQRRP